VAKYGVQNIHNELKNRLIEYVRSQYLGENDLLLEACAKMLEQEENVYQLPYIEANPAYLTKTDGLKELSIAPESRAFLNQLAEHNLGVYRHPFQHQIEALEQFYQGKNLFVTTGTGSGKTECFIWPMLTSLFEEALKRPYSWRERGVRTLLLYPMNALVSDQLTRLRRIIGDQEGRFRNIFRENIADEQARTPQFGMYTGRTPYPGEPEKKKSQELARTLQKDILNRQPADIEKLKRIGKYPAKFDLAVYLDQLIAGEHVTDEKDAELLTRFEMQTTCPDILITNYSMLELMLLRREEQPIWDNTKDWLNVDQANRLLVIIDEAHMYKGASGGEVALLLRRLMFRLGIGGEKIRFIMTSASIPHETDEEKQWIYQFAADFTAQDNPEKNFALIFGAKESLPEKGSLNLQAEFLAALDIDAFQGDDNTKCQAINDFTQKAAISTPTKPFATLSEAQAWLYDNLANYTQFLQLMNICRGTAVSLQEIASACFPGISSKKALQATQGLLAVAPLAKNKEGKVLFPARLHMLFQGLSGLFACSNPSCQEKNQGDGLVLGKIYSNDSVKECSCGGQVYELINDRRCGALFFRVFMQEKMERNRNYAWPNPGSVYGEELKEVHLYLVPADPTIKPSKDLKIAWLDSQTGFVYYDNDAYAGQKGFIKVAHSLKSYKTKPNQQTFGVCPKCGKRLTYYRLSDFSTKGNEPFYHIIKEQLRIQPPGTFDPEELKKFSNAGKKVLLFSDSRQMAAVLAKDMTRAADDEASRQAITLAVLKLQTWAQSRNEPAPSIQPYLYPAFLEVAAENNLQFFYGEDKDRFQEDLKLIIPKIERFKSRNELPDYAWLARNFQVQPGLYHEQLLKLICDQYRAQSDYGICWLEASDKRDVSNIWEDLEDLSIEITRDELALLISCWATVIAKEFFAVGHTIPDSVRSGIIKRTTERFGVKSDVSFPEVILKILKDRDYDEEAIHQLYRLFKREYLQKGEGTDHYYLNLEKLKLVYKQEHQWVRCRQCSGVYAFHLWGRCIFCGSENIYVMSAKDLERYSFWRKPVLEAVKNAEQGIHTITTINTEEHTAQLSHKDQRDAAWATTEKYELLFQNILMEGEIPIDILSCTTTMEVGIDIGSLTAVGLRNVPPMRENYQQRAGRAGRRGSSISTITTYTRNGPHDSYYFLNPREMITGKLRKPWIDVNNVKLLQRHLSMVVINRFMATLSEKLNTCSTTRFFAEFFSPFKKYLSSLELPLSELLLLLPQSQLAVFNEFSSWLLRELSKLEIKVQERPELYESAKGEEKSILDALLEEGVLPTYSFPKNVVGFYVEKENGSKIDLKPERALDIAISEYAPGKVLVVNKKTYKVGGIYSFNSKYKPRYYDKQAAPYFDDSNYIQPLYECPDNACGWVGTDYPVNGDCPFCRQEKVQQKMRLLKPWGFGPQNGKSIREAEAESEQSFVEEPCYSTPLEQDDLKKTPYQNIRIANRSDQAIIVLNKGPGGKGFQVCQDCGAAVAGEETLQSLERPYLHPSLNNGFKCRHLATESVYLGHRFLTDMVVLEFRLDPQKIDVQSKLWLKRAAVSLSEALALVTSRVMDIEFMDIRPGHRIRYNMEAIRVDIYLYDSLSSGAGYSSGVSRRLQDILTEVKKLLTSCGCAKACHNCLKHYWNQRNEDYLDKKAAWELLRWGEEGELAPALSLQEQWKIFQPLKKLLDREGHITSELLPDQGIQLRTGNKNKQLLVYPAMWNIERAGGNPSLIKIADTLLKEALPKAYEEVRGQW